MIRPLEARHRRFVGARRRHRPRRGPAPSSRARGDSRASRAGDRRAARTRAADSGPLLSGGAHPGRDWRRHRRRRIARVATAHTGGGATSHASARDAASWRRCDEQDPFAGRNRRADVDARRPAEPAAPVSDPPSGAVITYNFRRPDRVSKEQIRSLHFLHDRFARNVTTSLAAYLRALTEFSIVSVEQFSYSEFLMSLSDPTAYYAMSMSPLDGIAALEMNPTIAFTIVDRMLGGSGRGTPPQRALTEIEQNVIDSVVKLILENLTETWRAVFDLRVPHPGARDAAADAAGRRTQRSGHPAGVRSAGRGRPRDAQSVHPGQRHRSDGQRLRAGMASHAARADADRAAVAPRQPQSRTAAASRRRSRRGSGRGSSSSSSPAT